MPDLYSCYLEVKRSPRVKSPSTSIVVSPTGASSGTSVVSENMPSLLVVMVPTSAGSG